MRFAWHKVEGAGGTPPNLKLDVSSRACGGVCMQFILILFVLVLEIRIL